MDLDELVRRMNEPMDDLDQEEPPAPRRRRHGDYWGDMFARIMLLAWVALVVLAWGKKAGLWL